MEKRKMARNPFRWVEIYVQDMKRAKNFYESVFQVKLERLGNPATIEDSIEMWSFPSNAEEWGCSGALVKFGGKVERGKTGIGEYGFITLAVDTEGNVFGIHSMK